MRNAEQRLAWHAGIDEIEEKGKDKQKLLAELGEAQKALAEAQAVYDSIARPLEAEIRHLDNRISFLENGKRRLAETAPDELQKEIQANQMALKEVEAAEMLHKRELSELESRVRDSESRVSRYSDKAYSEELRERQTQVKAKKNELKKAIKPRKKLLERRKALEAKLLEP